VTGCDVSEDEMEEVPLDEVEEISSDEICLSADASGKLTELLSMYLSRYWNISSLDWMCHLVSGDETEEVSREVVEQHDYYYYYIRPALSIIKWIKDLASRWSAYL
jgi:hypothetical protein